MLQLLDILILVAMGAVLVTLGLGFHALYRGGDFARARSNKLMRLRILLQLVAVALLGLTFWLRSQGG